MENDIQVDNLEVGKVLIIKCNEDIINLWQLKEEQLQSYNNLFKAYVLKNYEEYDDFNLETFLDNYTKLRLEIDYIRDMLIKTSLGDSYDKVNSTFFFTNTIDFNNKLLIITIKKKREDN